ncbi:ATP-dependent endonuclease [Methanobrevibacter gottschalkii]|uniref:ATP-dependent nuclease n=1 Tax=Methanobrevibacter gottschalkii TaxID=190974 RepID=UPI0026F2FBD0|nr:ATP-binding protein [Methanobrevibacter gottschalkii]
MSIIKDLKIENDDYEIINSLNEDWLMNLSRINIFVGANNTGKSRFMRSLFYVDKDYTLKFLPNDPQFDTFLKQSEEFKKSINKKNGFLDSQDQRRAKSNILKSLHDIEFIEEAINPWPDLIRIYINIDNDSKKQPMSYEHECNEIFKKFFNEIEIDDNLFRYNFYRIYIPSLRGLIPLLPSEFKSEEQTNDLYAERIKKDYFPDERNIIIDVNDFLKKDDEDEPRVLGLKDIIENSKYYSKHSIITGLQFYDSVKNYLLGDLEQREMISEYEKYLSKTFFDRKEVALIPKVKDDVLTIKIGDEKERPIYNLGDGIQSIILITLPLFLYLDLSKRQNTNVLVFIEEPEIGLHPSLQRTLIETLLDERFENFQFFFTTHSNHFLDMQFENRDISIYSFDKSINNEESSINEFTVEKVDFNHFPTLEKLGALPSSVLANNCTILVEGSYDIVHYDFYLKLYQEKLKNENPDVTIFKKGVHYSFLRGGGKETLKTVKEFNTIQKERIYTILDFDSEEESEKNKAFFNDMNYTNYKILNVKEVENLISKGVLLKMLNSLREIRKLGITEDFDEEEYQKSNFYKFIKEKIIIGEIPDNFFNEDTLKERFCYKELDFTDNYDDLSDAAKEITEKIYEFIKKNN